MNPPARLFRWCLLLIALLPASVYLVASGHLFPAFGGDAASHLVPILNLKAGRGFESVIWSLTRDYDPTGQHRFLQYPPLFHLVVAGLIRQPTAASVSLCLGGFAVAALGLYVGLVWRMSVGGAAIRRHWMALAGLSLGAVSTWCYQLPSSGRPEAVTTPLALLAALCLTGTRPFYRPVVAGIFIGLIAAAQIANACLAGLLFAVYVSLQTTAGPARFGSWLAQVSAAALLSMLVFAACFLFSPHPFMETMRGIMVHLAQMPSDRRFSVVAAYVFPATSGTFYGLFLVVLLGHFAWWHRERLGWLGALNVAAFVGAAWLLAVRSSNHCYNLLALAPLLVAVALHLLASLDRSADPTVSPGTRGLIYAVYFGLFALMSVGFVRQVTLYAVYRRHGVAYEEARAHLRELLSGDADAPILTDGALWPLLDRFDHVYQHTVEGYSTLEPTPGSQKPILLVHQWYGRLGAPPAVPGYQLVWNDFVQQPPPRVLGIKVGTEMPGYAFAMYRPLPLDPQYQTTAHSSSSAP